MEFKDNLYNLRSQRKISQAKLAKDLNMSAGTIGMYESGTRMPSRAAQEKIADYFNVSLDYLMGRDSKSIYYVNPETARVAQEVFDDPNKRILFDAAEDATPEQLRKAAEYIKFLKWGDKNNDEPA